MKSDIVIADENHTLIIDTKYYTKTLQTNFDHKTIHSNNLYQIFTYVKKSRCVKSRKCVGDIAVCKNTRRNTPIFRCKIW
ncbi:MAG: hypothetical protein E7081_08690 [Bacteroidales bacterium]|nr:hypothetical protein [Bacteroidales bacterium]